MVEGEAESIVYKGYLKGHGGWVTCVQYGERDVGEKEKVPFLISGSRDKKLLVWDLFTEANEKEEIGKPQKMLGGHSHFIQDLSLSNDSSYAISGSWDKTIRLWNLKDFTSKMLFQGHGKDVLSVGFSSDNRMIVSAGRDRTIRMWNTLGVLKWTIDSAHDDWVSQVLFSKDKNTYIISAGWDKKIKIWDQNMNMKTSLAGNTRAINAIAISPNGQFLASGGREGVVRIMNLHNNTLTRSFDCKSSVNAISFSPSHYVCVAATDAGLHMYDIQNNIVSAMIKLDAIIDVGKKQGGDIAALSLCWNPTGNTLFVGAADKLIRAFQITS